MKKKIGKKEERVMGKKIIFMFALLLGVGVAFTSCSKNDSNVGLTDENSDIIQSNHYRISIPAEKKSTKAVADGGTATFKTTENVYICNTNNNNAIDAGVLHPSADAATAHFNGTLSGTYAVGNNLKVLYNTNSSGVVDYTSQNGTIQGVVDAGIATVKINKIEGNDIKTSHADIENLQSIFKFSFRYNGASMGVKNVTITSGGNKLQQSYNAVTGASVYGPVSVSKNSSSAIIYAALRFDKTGNDPITFVVSDGVHFYVATKRAPASGFATGKFYTSTIDVDLGFPYYGTANCLLMARTATSGTLNVSPYVTAFTAANYYVYSGISGLGYMPLAVKAELIWEEQVGLITSATISSDKTTMTVNRAAGKYGNALVGIYDASNNLLWSYHIWAPEDNPTTYDYTATSSSSRTYKVLNMPIGAIKYATSSSSAAVKAKALPLLYQWGRKDPLGRWNGDNSGIRTPVLVYDKQGNSINLTDNTYAKDVTNILNIFPYTSEGYNGPMAYHMIKYTISNPMIFIQNNTNLESRNKGWCNEVNSRALWGSMTGGGQIGKKSIFDPSPEGYSVASPGLWYNFTTTHQDGQQTEISTFNVVGNENFNWTSTNNAANGGYAFYYQGTGSGLSHFYVNGMYRGYTMTGGKLINENSWRGFYWNRAMTTSRAYGGVFAFGPEKVYIGGNYSTYNMVAAGGVICVKDE